jgi:PAS domain-containing protein
MYHAVIQQLKQQKHELQSLQLVERRRAKTSENISAAVLSNLSSGVLFFTPNGLVRQANASAKQILGFASPAGMSAAEVFRKAELISASDGAYASLAEAVNVSLREKKRFQRLEAQYRTPAGEERTLDITVSSVHAPDSEVLGAAGPGVAGPGVAGPGVAGPGVACLGVACLINDRTEMTEIRRQQELRGEMSGEMALGLRSSLTTIAGYAQQLAASRDPELARQLASDIAAEAAHLDRTIGGFLAGAKAARAGSKA